MAVNSYVSVAAADRLRRRPFRPHLSDSSINCSPTTLRYCEQRKEATIFRSVPRRVIGFRRSSPRPAGAGRSPVAGRISHLGVFDKRPRRFPRPRTSIAADVPLRFPRVSETGIAWNPVEIRLVPENTSELDSRSLAIRDCLTSSEVFGCCR